MRAALGSWGSDVSWDEEEVVVVALLLLLPLSRWISGRERRSKMCVMPFGFEALAGFAEME